MTLSNILPGPINQFLKGLGDEEHVVLFYAEPSIAKIVNFAYIKDGLAKGQHCIYTTHGNPAVLLNEMKAYGIASKRSVNQLLHVYKINDPINGAESLWDNAWETIETITRDSVPPYRIVSRLVAEKYDDRHVDAVAEVVEPRLHANFGKLKGSWLCPHNIASLKHNLLLDWVDSVSRNHHAVLFANNRGKMLAYRRQLMVSVKV